MIPVDGALAALREGMRELGQFANGEPWAPEYMAVFAAVECVAMAIEQAQSAERGAVPLHVATADASIEARAKVARAAYLEHVEREWEEQSDPSRERWRNVVRAVDASRPDPEHARVTMTPIDRLRVIAGLVMTLPHGKASHEVALGHDEHAFAMLSEAGATVACNDLGDVGIILRATLHLDGVRFTAQKDGEGVST